MFNSVENTLLISVA